jgi:GNAT superfamily N-acetyltransferase
VIALKNVIVLRLATAEDESFVDGLLFTTMHRYVKTTWPNNLKERRHYYKINSFAYLKARGSNTRILRVSGKDIGRLSTTLRPNCLFIDELHILPKFQRKGIGKQAIEEVLKEAREKGLPVRGTVLKVNHPSLCLCLGMGFEVVALRDHRLHIRYRGGRSQTKDPRR